jgi:hypothetical protein
MPVAFDYNSAFRSARALPEPGEAAQPGRAYDHAICQALAGIGLDVSVSEGPAHVLFLFFDEGTRQMSAQLVPASELGELDAGIKALNGSFLLEPGDADASAVAEMAKVLIALNHWPPDINDTAFGDWFSDEGIEFPDLGELAGRFHAVAAKVGDGQTASVVVPGTLGFVCAFRAQTI